MRVQPRKVRIIADQVRGKSAQHTADILKFHPSKGAFVLRKVIVNAIANAVENNQADPRNLTIQTIQVDEGPKIKRIQARAMGRANRIEKKMSHITVVVEESEPTAKVKPHGTQAKPRPTLSAGKKKSRKAEAKAAAPAPVEEAVEEKVEETAAVEEVQETTAEVTEQAAEAPAESAEEKKD